VTLTQQDNFQYQESVCWFW